MPCFGLRTPSGAASVSEATSQRRLAAGMPGPDHDYIMDFLALHGCR
jgi:hypothetical protein